MANMKYIIMDHRGCDTPILFPVWVGHDEIYRHAKVIGAGECSVSGTSKEIEVGSRLCNDIEVYCYGKSVSLDVVSRGYEDAALIREMLLKS